MSNNNDFKSLFSTFKAALGPSGSSNDPRANNSKAEKEASSNNLSLKDRIQRQWRIAQIKQAKLPSSILSCTPDKPMIKVAICAVIVDDLRYESVWRRWADDGENYGLCDFVVHAKHPERIRSSWLRQKTLDFSHRPNWNDVRVIKAMLDTVKQALKDPDVTHVVFITESCIPITPFKDFVKYLKSNPEKSFLRYHDSSSGSRYDELEIWSKLNNMFPLSSLHKALPGWITMCREHAKNVLDLEYTVDLFENIWAPEEVYFPTMLALTGALANEVINSSLTFAKWPTGRKDNKAHPLTFILNKNDIEDWQKGGYFFARKFSDKIDDQRWKDVVQECSTHRSLKRTLPESNKDDSVIDNLQHVFTSRENKSARLE